MALVKVQSTYDCLLFHHIPIFLHTRLEALENFAAQVEVSFVNCPLILKSRPQNSMKRGIKSKLMLQMRLPFKLREKRKSWPKKKKTPENLASILETHDTNFSFVRSCHF